MHGVRFWGGEPVQGHRFPDASARADYVDDPKYWPNWERIRDLDVPVNAQATMPQVLPNTRRLLERYPELHLTLINLARVPVSEGSESQAAKALLGLSEFPHTFVNFSAGFIEEMRTGEAARELLHALIERFGARRLLWTTFGVRMRESVQATLDALTFLAEADRSAIVGQAARDLYPSLREHLPD
jgi:predicted TIM-barrel fold metal-dependent hydrolase